MDPTNNIGAWKLAFQALSYVAIISNIALILQNESVWNYLLVHICDGNTVLVCLLAGLIEHGCILVRWVIMNLINDRPSVIVDKIEKARYIREMAEMGRKASAQS